MYEIESIVWTTGYSHSNIASHPSHFNIIHGVIDAYEQDLPNLLKRSNQSGHTQNLNQQEIGYWPSPDYLRKRTMMGSKYRGMKFIGANNVSDGSNLIIDLADEDDDRPVWVTIWGGGNTLAQAIWQVIECANQLRGRCGERQVKNPKVAMAQTYGLMGNSGTTILSI